MAYIYIYTYMEFANQARSWILYNYLLIWESLSHPSWCNVGTLTCGSQQKMHIYIYIHILGCIVFGISELVCAHQVKQFERQKQKERRELLRTQRQQYWAMIARLVVLKVPTSTQSTNKWNISVKTIFAISILGDRAITETCAASLDKRVSNSWHFLQRGAWPWSSHFARTC